jgi:hypothetical protein
MASPFAHIDAIYTNQRIDYYDTLSEADRKSFSPYLISMGISMTQEFLPIANEANKYWDQLDARSTYLFYSQILPKGKRYSKWVKGKKDDRYPDWLIARVAQHYQVSTAHAMEYLDIFHKDDTGRAGLLELLERYGTDPKLIKKLKL